MSAAICPDIFNGSDAYVFRDFLVFVFTAFEVLPTRQVSPQFGGFPARHNPNCGKCTNYFDDMITTFVQDM